MKVRKGKFSGTIGHEVYVDSKYGQVVRTRPRRPYRRTTARLDVWGIMQRVAGVWRRLTDKQRAAWEATVKKLKGRRPGGRPVPPDGFHLFCKINCALVAAGLPLVKDPPKPENTKR